MSMLKYLRTHINKETEIETKDLGVFRGVITAIDSKMNVTIENALIAGKKVARMQLRGSRVRSFFLQKA
ncbi:hypothetical protein PAPHI01_0003 [Pancytospora philotis]|nr:hypothetical protein PAPHI01_0003 [Pancytospora philotis]